MRFDERGDIPYQLGRLMNGGIDFENMRGALVEVDVNGETEVQHGLGYVPVGYIVLAKFGKGEIWSTRRLDWNPRSIYLESDVQSLKVRLFVM